LHILTKIYIVEYDNNDKKVDSVFSTKIRAGKRRTYFFDVRATKANDYFLTITESRKRSEDNGFDRHKIFLYKEDFNKFLKALIASLDHVKTDLMPDFDFNAFNHDFDPENSPTYPNTSAAIASKASTPIAPSMNTDELKHPILNESSTTESTEPTKTTEAAKTPKADDTILRDDEVDKW